MAAHVANSPIQKTHHDTVKPSATRIGSPTHLANHQAAAASSSCLDG